MNNMNIRDVFLAFVRVPILDQENAILSGPDSHCGPRQCERRFQHEA